MKNPNFLKSKYNLHNALEVESAAKRTEKRTGEKVPQNPEKLIQNYLDRFSEIFERKEPAKRERGIEALKTVLHDKFIIKPEEISESYFDSIKRKHRDEGYGNIEIPEDYRKDLSKTIVGDQEKSLDRWIDYLCSDQDKHDYWLKYYAFRSILKMGRYDRKKNYSLNGMERLLLHFQNLIAKLWQSYWGTLKKMKTKKQSLNLQNVMI